MAYKRNPMRAERMCSLARFLSGMPAIAAHTAATQWLERTLDDSASRRLAIPQAFLAADGVLRLAGNIVQGLVVNTEVIKREVADYLPYLVTEELLMAAVRKGGDRQELHERIRRHSLAVASQTKEGGKNDLIDRLKADPAFARLDFSDVIREEKHVGRSAEQVDEFLDKELIPAISKYPNHESDSTQISV